MVLDMAFPDDISDEVKISTKIRKGGREVQKGLFRRVDYYEQEEKA